MKLPEKVEIKLRDIPDKPGCYLMRDKQGRIIYVGKAVSLRKRVQSYFRDATRRRGDLKLRGLVKSVYDLDYIVVGNEAEALLTEGRLIKEFKPYYNIMFKDDKRFIMLSVDMKEPYPRFKTCRIQKNDGALYFGPYVSSSAVKAVLDFIEKKFGLRKCQPRMPDEITHKHCINDIVRFCSAPCVGKVSAEQYMERVEEACAFLRGERSKYVSELRAEMTAASDKREFERAASIRDIMFMIDTVIRQNGRVAQTPAMKVEDGKQGVQALGVVVGLGDNLHSIEAYDISNISGTYAVASMVSSMDGIARKNRYRRFRIKTIEGSDDPGMMAEVIRRRFARLLKEKTAMPDLVLVDGGITQMRAARAELDKLGIGRVRVAGLAKRFEELYVQDQDRPVRLDKDSSALKVLQRLRDEAHRFALSYHHRLRNRTIKDSLLDDIPGIGPERKRILLERFGSVKRLMKASEDEIAKVPGIGKSMAKVIKGTEGRQQ